MLRTVLHGTRLVIATIIGWSLIALGLVLLVTPGPGLLALAAGTAILARHYRTAAVVRGLVHDRARTVADRLGRTGPRTGTLGASPAETVAERAA